MATAGSTGSHGTAEDFGKAAGGGSSKSLLRFIGSLLNKKRKNATCELRAAAIGFKRLPANPPQSDLGDVHSWSGTDAAFRSCKTATTDRAVDNPSPGAFFVVWGDRNDGKTYSTHALCHSTTAFTPSRAFSFSFPRGETDYFGYLVKQLGLPKKTNAAALSQVVTNALLKDDDLVNDASSKPQKLSKMRCLEEELDSLGADTFKSEDDLPFLATNSKEEHRTNVFTSYQGRHTPVAVFHNVNNLEIDSPFYKFFGHLMAHRCVVFVTTISEKVAYTLLFMNGGQKVCPLIGFRVETVTKWDRGNAAQKRIFDFLGNREPNFNYMLEKFQFDNDDKVRLISSIFRHLTKEQIMKIMQKVRRDCSLDGLLDEFADAAAGADGSCQG